jgi:ribosomal protein L25 (general stress protein Ctc)
VGRIPGVIYGKDKDNKVLKILVTTDLQDVLHEISERQVKFETTTYEVVLKNDKGNEVGRYICVPRDTTFSSSTVTLL